MATPRRIRQLEYCNPTVFGDVCVTRYQHNANVLTMVNPKVKDALWINSTALTIEDSNDCKEFEKRRCSVMVDQLLLDIYSNYQIGTTDYNSATSSKSSKFLWLDGNQLAVNDTDGLKLNLDALQREIVRAGSVLVRRLKRRDALRRQRDARCDVISFLLRKCVPEFSPEMRFSLEPLPGDSGFSQWHSAMKMVSQLPEGIPPEFRSQLWLSLADKHLHAKGIDWSQVERNCFSEWSHPSDGELGVQIVKDLHRTGCSLFCGKDGKENQALLKRVLLAYARWNKAVGYCQGFNMLAALILQVTDKSESDALKLMIYLIEGVLPDSYFADSLRGLSVDMAVFRELLRTKLPKLSRHLDTLQVASKEGTTSYEPPLTNVFTMQWFLTLFCNCLPQPTVLRIWDLILLEGNEILLRTSLAIWQVLAERIMTAKSADEFYCVMGVLMREILEYDLIDANTLIKGIVAIGPLTELSSLREHYLYNINPWGSAPTARDTDRRMKVYHKDKLVLDIGVLKKQYTKLKQRQRQAHIIFNTAVARQTTRPAPVAVNHLLLGKSALVPAKRLGPPKGAVPPPRQQPQVKPKPKPVVQPPPKTLHWKDTRPRSSSSSSSSSSDTELCDDPNNTGESDDELAKSQLPDDNLPTDVTTATTVDLPNNLTNNRNLNQISDSDIVTKETLMTFKDDPEPVSSAPVNCVIPDLLDFVEPSLAILTDEVSFSDTLSSFETFDPLETFQPIENYKTYDSEMSSDIFDTDVNDSDYFKTFNQKLQRSDSLPSEDGFDFEKFLEERVKCLKEKPYSSEESLEDTSEQDRVKYARKNSVRALEIIQENSLILHRILQCQSRLTPTPPPCDDILLVVDNPARGRDVDGEETNVYFEEETTPTNNPEFDENTDKSFPPYDHFSSFSETKYQIGTVRNDHVKSPTYVETDTDERCKETKVYEKYMLDFNDYKQERKDDNVKGEVTDQSGTAIITDFVALGIKLSGNIESPENKIDIRSDDIINDDDTAYINEFISKYNFISKSHQGIGLEQHQAENEDRNERECETLADAKPIHEIENESPHFNANSLLSSFLPISMEVESTTNVEPILPTHATTNIVEVDYNLEKYRHKLGSPLSEQPAVESTKSEHEFSATTQTQINTDRDCVKDKEKDIDREDLIEIDKNSKYNSILEYSRNLDEKFNNLILKSPKLTKLQSDKLNLKSNYSLDVPDTKSELNLISGEKHEPKPSQSYSDFTNIHPSSGMNSSGSLITTTEMDQPSEAMRNTIDVDALIESPNLKSPNRIYNPFPVNISSRQNKEVPFRLGLYKK